MISKADIKFIKSLYVKKHRQSEGLFVAEGSKTVGELLPNYRCRRLLATGESALSGDPRAERVSYDELCRASNMECPQDTLAVFEIKEWELRPEDLRGRLSIALDGVQDAGNLGTIIRLADWFGARDVICSPSTVDAYNPKTVQASAGALARVRVHYAGLPELLRSLSADIPVYGTALDGGDMYAQKFGSQGIIVLGSEGNGISAAVRDACSHLLRIPSYPEGAEVTESLNVGTAAAVFLAEFRRQNAVDGI